MSKSKSAGSSTDTKRVTARAVAEASGVSRATVSFVLNNTPNQTISVATRERVQHVAQELGYVPSGIARALREGVSRAVVLNIDSNLEGNYSRSYIRGLDNELAAHDHVLFVRYGRSTSQATQRVLDVISPRAVIKFGEPFIGGYELNDAGGGWRDGYAAHVAMQIRHLADAGHTGMALALPDYETPMSESRLRFANQTAETLGVEPVTPFVMGRPRSAGVSVVKLLLKAHSEITAIAAFDDDVALQVLTALYDLGRTVPDDVAVIGYDDNEYGSLSTPALTTIHIDAESHGKRVARVVLGLDDNDVPSPTAQVVVRDSV